MDEKHEVIQVDVTVVEKARGHGPWVRLPREKSIPYQDQAIKLQSHS